MSFKYTPMILTCLLIPYEFILPISVENIAHNIDMSYYINQCLQSGLVNGVSAFATLNLATMAQQHSTILPFTVTGIMR